MTTNATAVANRGAIQATCSFHSMPNVCHNALAGSASNTDRGLVGNAARYHGFTIQVPVITVIQAARAITDVPISSLGNRSRTPVGVTRFQRKLYNPARPPANASRNSE